MTEKEVLESFVNSDHYKLSQIATPIIEKIKKRLPYNIDTSTNGLKFTVLNKGTRTLGRLESTFNRATGKETFELKVSKYLLEPNMRGILTNTLIHELAHYFAIKWKGEEAVSHGYHWGYIMISMGIEPDKYATPTEARAMRQARVVSEKAHLIYSECATCNKTSMAELKNGKYICEVCGNEVDEA